MSGPDGESPEQRELALQEVLALLQEHLRLTGFDGGGDAEQLRAILRQRDEGIAWLRGEVAARDAMIAALQTRLEKRAHSPLRRAAQFVRKLTYPVRHPFRWLAKMRQQQ